MLDDCKKRGTTINDGNYPSFINMKINTQNTTSSAGYTADIAPPDNHNYYRIVTGANNVVVQTRNNRRFGQYKKVMQESCGAEEGVW